MSGNDTPRPRPPEEVDKIVADALPDAWPNDPNGSLVPILEASVEAAKERHPSNSGDTPGVVLTGADRCDGCSQQALYRVVKQSVGLPLLSETHTIDFCRHHHGKHFPEMEKTGWTVVGTNPTLHAELYGGKG